MVPVATTHRRRSPRIAGVAAGTVFVVTAIAAGISGLGSGRPEPIVPLAGLENGVNAASVAGIRIFVVVEDDVPVTVFRSDVHHQGAERLWWCPNEHVFAGPYHGETFDAAGRRIWGPSARGLDRYPFQVRNDSILVNLERPILGEERTGSDGTFFGPDEQGPWDSGAGTFCDGANRN